MAVQDTDRGNTKIRQKVFEPVMFGPYCLIDRVSKGGMSDIYLAKMSGGEGFQKPVVIKKLLPKYSAKSNYVKRFVNEAKTLARLNHSNVVQIYDMGAINGEYFIALEYIEGRNVAHVISKAAKTRHVPSLEFVLHVVLELARGLAYAHRKRGESGESLMLAHQDINSFNVMVSYEAEVKIIDFGIAQVFLDRQEVEGLPVAGKLLYFSPEQLLRKPVDRRVDVYGTGVLMYELLTGRRLVDHQESVSETVRAILDTDVTVKVRANDRIDDSLKPILMKAMAFDPNDRYSWMEEMIEDIQGVIVKSNLCIDQLALSRYLKEQFHREILLDRRRLRRLVSENLPRSTNGEKRRAALAPRSSQGPKALPLDGAPLSPFSWPFFENTSAEQRLAPTVRLMTFAKGKVIYRRGDPGTEVLVILKGQVRLGFPAAKDEQTLAILEEGDFFGEATLIGEFQRIETAVAQNDCELVCLDRESFARLFEPGLSLSVVLNLVQKLRDSRSLLEGIFLEDNLSRLIFGLLHLRRKSVQQNGMEIDLSQLKDMFRLENVDQVRKYLAKLESLNVLEADGDAVRIKNSETLESILHVLSGQGKFVLKL